jgi:hypothetical protein
MAAALIIATLAICQAQEPQISFQAYPLPIGLTVSLPDKPEALKTEKGENRKAFVSEAPDGLYFVSHAPIDAGDLKTLPPDQLIAAYIFGAMGDDPDKHLTRYSDVLLDGWPGIEIAIDDTKESKTIWSRCYELNGHMVETGVVYDTGNVPSGAKDFFASLKQTDMPKYGPVASNQFTFMHIEPDGVPIRLDFPGDVQEEKTDLGKDDYKMTVHDFNYSRDMRTFDFTYLDLPDGSAEAIPADGAEDIRQHALDALMKNLGADKDSSTTEERDGNDWLTARFHIKSAGYGRADILYLKGRVFALFAVGPEPWQDSPEYKRFFDSVEIKD